MHIILGSDFWMMNCTLYSYMVLFNFFLWKYLHTLTTLNEETIIFLRNNNNNNKKMNDKKHFLFLVKGN